MKERRVLRFDLERERGSMRGERKWREGGRGWSRGRDYRGWVPVTRRRRRQRSLDGAPSMLINSFAHAVYRVHALIKREPAITIIPRICSDFLGRTSERRPSNVDGWMDGRCRLNDPGKREKEEKKEKETSGSLWFPRSREFFGWKKFLKEGEGERKSKWSL